MNVPDARRRPCCFLSMLLLATLPVHAGVLVVDEAGGPGSDFTAIQDAIDAGVDGDTILVRDGVYAPFSIDGKSLSVVADGTDVMINVANGVPTISVLNLAEEQAVLVQGMQANFGVSVTDCAGGVWFEDFQNAPPATYCNNGSAAGASVTRSAQVTFTRCSMVGGADHGGFTPPSTAAGVYALASTVQLYDCEIEGAQGTSKYWFPAQPGAAGLCVDASTVTIVGCTIAGGGGGLEPTAIFGGGTSCTVVHPPGGAGVQFVGAAGTVQSAESTAVGGVTSLEPLCPGQTGPPGPAISGSGTIVPLVGYARHVQAGSPVRGGETLTFALEAQPGEVPFLFVSLAHEPVPLLQYSGVLLAGLPWSDMFLLGALPAGGQTSFSFPVPNIGGLVGGLTYYAQAAFLDASSRIWLGAGTSVVLLDASY